MTTDESPRWYVSLRVVMVRVTLHELSPNAAPNAVSAAISTEMTILMICCLSIIICFSLSTLFNQVSVRVIVPVQLVHRIAEQRTDFGLCLELGLQLRFLRRVAQDGSHSRRYFRKPAFGCRLGCTRRFVTGVTEFAGRCLAGHLVRPEIHIAVHTYFFLHALYQSHRFNLCHDNKVCIRHILADLVKITRAGFESFLFE